MTAKMKTAEPIQRILADNKLMATSNYSDAVVVDMGTVYQIQFSGMAAIDPVSKTVTGYDAHNGVFLADALEQQVADIFGQLERMNRAISKELKKKISVANLTRALVFLREDYPRAFGRFNDAYIEQFRKRKIGNYPARTTILRTTLPEPNALVEIQFDAMAAK